MNRWMELAGRAVEALERIAEALESAAASESTGKQDRQEDRDAAA